MTHHELLLRAVFNALLGPALLTYSVVSCLTGPFLRYDVLSSLGFGVFFGVSAVVHMQRYCRRFTKNASSSPFQPGCEKAAHRLMQRSHHQGYSVIHTDYPRRPWQRLMQHVGIRKKGYCLEVDA